MKKGRIICLLSKNHPMTWLSKEHLLSSHFRINLLIKEKVIIRGVKGPYPTHIITLLKDTEYLATLREKLDLIKKMRRINANPC